MLSTYMNHGRLLQANSSLHVITKVSKTKYNLIKLVYYFFGGGGKKKKREKVITHNLMFVDQPTTKFHTWHMSIWVPPCKKSALRPTLSTVAIETKVANMLTRPVITADMSAASSSKPMVLKRTGA